MTHISPCLSYSIDNNHKEMVFKTKKQLEVMLNSTSEQWITGPAGSGKTWLLMEKVKLLAEKALLRDTKEKILVVCYNRPLSKMFLKTFKRHLTNSLPDGDLSSVLEVKTFGKLLWDITGLKLGDSDQEKEKHVSIAVNLMEQRPIQYDHVFVDECQDLYGDWPMLFKTLQKGDDDDHEPKHVWLLFDTNQYLGLREEQHQQHYKNLKNSTKLTKVFRNTGNVFQQSRKYYKSTVTGDPILGHCETGLAIRWDGSLKNTVVSEREGVQEILKHLQELRQNKVQTRDICILVKTADIRKSLISELQRVGVQSQDAEKLYELTASKENQSEIIVESIWRFKGLESKVVVLYNPPICEVIGSVSRTKYLYTAISRCFCYLVVITTKRGCEALQSEKGIQRIRRSQVGASLKKSSEKRALETQYESGHPESLYKRNIEGDDDVGDGVGDDDGVDEGGGGGRGDGDDDGDDDNVGDGGGDGDGDDDGGEG